MATVKIDLSEQLAAALTARAAAEGLTLEHWLQKLAEVEARRSRIKEPQHAASERDSVVEEVRKLRAGIEPDPEGWTVKDYIEFGRR